MKERPILFSAPMVRAILDGSKTQTRRIVKPQPSEGGLDWIETEEGFAAWQDPLLMLDEHSEDGGPCQRLCPHGQPGDRLWVRETLHRPNGVNGAWWYRADDAPVDLVKDDKRVPLMFSWAQRVERDVCVSIHMPKWASRITLEITDVRVERLNDISEEDATAEGVETDLWDMAPVARRYGFEEAWFIGWPDAARGDSRSVGADEVAKCSFASLWEQTNGSGSWEANPWVWVIEFRRVEPCAA